MSGRDGWVFVMLLGNTSRALSDLCDEQGVAVVLHGGEGIDLT